MDTSSAKRLVIVSCASAAALASAAELSRGQFPSARIPVGAIAAGAMLSVLAEVQPKVAGAFAGVILVTAVFVVGGDAWRSIGAIFGAAPAPQSLGAAAGRPA